MQVTEAWEDSGRFCLGAEAIEKARKVLFSLPIASRNIVSLWQ